MDKKEQILHYHQHDGNEGFVLSDPSQSFLNSLYVKQHSCELLFYNVNSDWMVYFSITIYTIVQY